MENMERSAGEKLPKEEFRTWAERLEAAADEFSLQHGGDIAGLEAEQKEKWEAAKGKILAFGKLDGILREINTALDRELAKPIPEIDPDAIDNVELTRNHVAEIVKEMQNEMDTALEESFILKQKLDALRKKLSVNTIAADRRNS